MGDSRPAFALVYPLWASIRAIETSSKYHMKKLVTYWIIFSLVSLFEIFFVKLIEWVPFWPYIRLVAVCGLVIPRFNGASHVYQHLVHPCLSVNPQDIINWFSSPKDKPYSEDSFLASAETYLKENGPEALEKLIASKAKHEEQILTDADALEQTKENITAEEQLVEHPKLRLVESEKKEVAALEAQRVTTPAESKEKRPLEVHALKKVQREWTCAVCQLTTESAATLNSHFLGKEHRSNCAKLKKRTQTTNNMQSSAAKDKSRAQTTKNMHSSVAKDKSNTEELKTSKQTSNDLRSSSTKTNDSNQTKSDAKICLPGEGSKENTTEKLKSMQINAACGQQQMQEKPKQVNASVKQQPKLECRICNITCSGEMNMASHLKGRKHLEKTMYIDASSGQLRCSICNITCTGDIDMACHINGRKHLDKTMYIDASSGQLRCSLCNITCTREIDMACHINGRKHLLNLQND